MQALCGRQWPVPLCQPNMGLFAGPTRRWPGTLSLAAAGTWPSWACSLFQKKRASDCPPPGYSSATYDLLGSSPPAPNGCRQVGKLRLGTSFSVCCPGSCETPGPGGSRRHPPLVGAPGYNPPARCQPFPPHGGFCPGQAFLPRHLGDHSHSPVGFSTFPAHAHT